MGREVKKILSKALTLSHPRWRFFIFLGVLILLRVLPFFIIEKTRHFSVCSLILGKYCYSVGLTRGISTILRGDLSGGLEYNILSIFVLGILVIFIIHDLFKGFIKRKS